MKVKWHNKEENSFGLTEVSSDDAYVLKNLGLELVDKDGFIDSKNGNLSGKLIEIWKPKFNK